MADVTPTSGAAKSSDALRTLIANSATFQTAVGADDAAEAAAAIHIAAYTPDDPDDGWSRPFALIHRSTGGTARAVRTCAATAGGELKVLFEKEISEAYRDDDQADNAQLEMENFVGDVIDECLALAASPGYLFVREMDITDAPYRYASNELKHVMACCISVRYGLTG